MANRAMPNTMIESAIFQGRLNRRLRHNSGNANGPITKKSNVNTTHGLSHHAVLVLLDTPACPAVGVPHWRQ